MCSVSSGAPSPNTARIRSMSAVEVKGRWTITAESRGTGANLAVNVGSGVCHVSLDGLTGCIKEGKQLIRKQEKS